jgi:pimeloyl-ACP methyl ester carboxylesterase
MGRLKYPVEVDVSAAVPLPGEHVVRGTMIASGPPTQPLVWCCLPGGGCTSSYFDLEVDGDDVSYSMAAYLADAGGVVLALDHLGTGRSTPLADDFLLTPDILAGAHHAAFSELFGQLRAGNLIPEFPAQDQLVPIGLGHSMGAMITMVQQAEHATYAAVVNLGSMGSGLPEHVRDPQWLETEISTARSSLVEMARVQFGPGSSRGPASAAERGDALFHAEDVPPPVRAAFKDKQTNLLPSCALATLIPAFTDPERAAITVPLFLGFGEHDLSPDPHDSVGRYRSATDVTLYIVAGSGHCHNQAGHRRQLWERLSAWAGSVVTSGKSGVGTERRVSV